MCDLCALGLLQVLLLGTSVSPTVLLLPVAANTPCWAASGRGSVAHTSLLAPLQELQLCHSPLYLLNSGCAPSTELFLFICAHICFAQLVVQWKPNVVFNSSGFSLCRVWSDLAEGWSGTSLVSPRGESSVLGAAVVAGQHQRCFLCSLSCPSQTPGQPRSLELPREVVLELSWVWQGAPGQRGNP